MIKIGLGALGQEIRIREGFQHSGLFLFLRFEVKWMRRRVREKTNLVGVGVEGGSFHSPEVGVREEKIVAEDDRAKSLDCSRELLVRIK